MNSHDSLNVATQIAYAKDQIIEAVKGLTAPWYKGPMMGALIVAGISGAIAIWSLRRNTDYDREKRTEDRKKEMLHEVRKIYGELVALNIQLINETIAMNYAKFSYELYLARLSFLRNSNYDVTNTDYIETDILFKKNLDLNEKKVNDVNEILHKYISLLAEYGFLTNSLAMEKVIESITAKGFELKLREKFEGSSLEKMVVSLEKQLLEARQILHRDIGNIGKAVKDVILEEKSKYN